MDEKLLLAGFLALMWGLGWGALNECMGLLAVVEHHLRNARQGKYEARTRRN